MPSLEETREKINTIDEQLVPLFLERMECSVEVAKVKKEQGLPVLNQAREDEILQRLTMGLSEEDAAAVKDLYIKIFEISRNRQSRFLDTSCVGSEK